MSFVKTGVGDTTVHWAEEAAEQSVCGRPVGYQYRGAAVTHMTKNETLIGCGRCLSALSRIQRETETAIERLSQLRVN